MKEKERLWNILYNWVKKKGGNEELLQNIRFCKLFYLRLIKKPDSDPENRHTDPNIYLNANEDGICKDNRGGCCTASWTACDRRGRATYTSSAENPNLKFDVEGIFGRELMEIYRTRYLCLCKL